MSVLVPARGTSRPARPGGAGRLEVVLALAAFAVLCVVALRVHPLLVEPDDSAYRASIVAVTQGHFLTLSPVQVQALATRLGASVGRGPGGPIIQWVQLANGRWISEKDPGYPYLAAPFQALGLIRLAPLFFGALASLGLFAGGRRSLGRYGGAGAGGGGPFRRGGGQLRRADLGGPAPVRVPAGGDPVQPERGRAEPGLPAGPPDRGHAHAAARPAGPGGHRGRLGPPAR